MAVLRKVLKSRIDRDADLAARTEPWKHCVSGRMSLSLSGSGVSRSATQVAGCDSRLAYSVEMSHVAESTGLGH